MTENKYIFIHMEFVVMMITLITGFYTLHSKIEHQGQRTDRLFEIFEEQSQAQTRRTDKIYDMFMARCKENKI